MGKKRNETIGKINKKICPTTSGIAASNVLKK